jgi:hypothetical protein
LSIYFVHLFLLLILNVGLLSVVGEKGVGESLRGNRWGLAFDGRGDTYPRDGRQDVL